ncbi:MAG: methyltransferase domain-containing protein [Candidatus Hydrogenedentes bacterium]|nr:methyltransferase domain-containing protein [Candidatus Hydrogenedentota bacterium]
MEMPMSRFWPIFFELFESLPRQGPGNRACAARVLARCADLPAEPAVLDLGCGVGGQTLHLAELTSGTIIALDSHAPSIERLRETVNAKGLAGRVRPVVGDMADPGVPAASQDLIWSEGALYNIGIPRALGVCHRLLRPGGYLAFTDPVWRVENPPPEIRAIFESDYPAMGRAADIAVVIDQSGFSLLDHFPLPDEAWWEDFYTPMERRIAELREVYSGDAEALEVLDQLAQEPELHRKYSSCYAYEFFVARKQD